MRCVSWNWQPFADHAAALPPIAVSDGDPALAAELVSVLVAAGHTARLCSRDDVGTNELAVVTEGLLETDIAERHWRVLDACKGLRGRVSGIVLLERVDSRNVETVSGLQGLSRTLRQEWPDTDVFTLSLEQSPGQENAARLIADGLIRGVKDARLSKGGCATQQVSGAPALQSVIPEDSDVWLVSGGARGVTAACIVALAARQGGSTFILAGRSAIVPWPEGVPVAGDLKSLRASLITAARGKGQKPALPDIDRQARAALAGQEIRETLQAIERAGSRAHYVPVDVSDADAVRQAVKDIVAAHGPVTGLVHGAGVLADSLAEKKTREDVMRVFQPKVRGLINLLGALDMSALRRIGLFSSAAAVFGNTGQSDYAMANEWLNAVAWQLHRARPDMLVKSFCWGPWEGGMVDATLAAHFAEKGIGLIGLEDGVRVFADQMLQGVPEEVQLLIGDEWSA